MRVASRIGLALIATSARTALAQETAEGFGAHIEGASVDAAGRLYATHFRGTADSSFAGNGAGRNAIGRIDATTGETALFFEGEPEASFNGMRWHADGRSLFLADVGQNKVVKVDLATMTGTDHCGGPGSLIEGKGAPNDLALSKSGLLFLSGQQWEGSTGGLWLCRPDGELVELEGGMARTNGIALSPDDGTLYLTEAAGSPVADAGAAAGQRIWRYTVSSDGSVSGKTEFFNLATDMVPPEADADSDGMRTDAAGNLYVTRNGKGKVLVISKAGALLKELELMSTTYPTNLAFGGPGGRTLYVVGRCADASWGEGDGCVEAVAADEPGREWAWLRESAPEVPATTAPAPAPTTPAAATTTPAPAPATTPAAATTSAAAPGGTPCAAEWQQCGGEGWSGPACCGEGLECRARGRWFSQCAKPHPQKAGRGRKRGEFLKLERGESPTGPVLLQSASVLQQQPGGGPAAPGAGDAAAARSEL